MADTMNPLRPRPEPDSESASFWAGLQQRQLLIQRCRGCERYRFPPSETCPHCRCRESDWLPASGRGSIFSWIVVRHPVPSEIFADEVPYIVVLVELEEGVRIASNLIGIEPEKVRDRLQVRLVFREAGPDRILHAFRPDDDSREARPEERARFK